MCGILAAAVSIEMAEQRDVEEVRLDQDVPARQRPRGWRQHRSRPPRIVEGLTLDARRRILRASDRRRDPEHRDRRRNRSPRCHTTTTP